MSADPVEVKCAGECGRPMGYFERPVVITCSVCTARARNRTTTGNPGMKAINLPGRHARRRAAGVSRSRAGR